MVQKEEGLASSLTSIPQTQNKRSSTEKYEADDSKKGRKYDKKESSSKSSSNKKSDTRVCADNNNGGNGEFTPSTSKDRLILCQCKTL